MSWMPPEILNVHTTLLHKVTSDCDFVHKIDVLKIFSECQFSISRFELKSDQSKNIHHNRHIPPHFHLSKDGHRSYD
ncbi:hypothetical protein RIR_jg29831.t1 [Rhizophagus irregularis DAOM 181602=DAOM 197198]|nr:hypothetical protein RIR_jg29831.t1 [Rhizophagus irregularis DAOM 181602=DAOM 197198]